ncbi:MAG TPA: phospholipid scramblase-related protein [Thermoanaerobaculia bacterium]|nr:phospholipid scramblase-related protein [Thermoanaerobaculia bacterium]
MLDRQTYVVKERVGFMKLASVYDLLDPDTGAPIGIAKEEPPGIVKYLRLAMNNKWLPTIVNVYEREGAEPVLSIHRGVALLRPKVYVTAGAQQLGYFRAKALSIGPSFRMFDMQDREIGSVKGDWKGWNFQLLGAGGEELGRVTKKWAGLAKELFTNADTYVISLGAAATGRRDVAQLLLAAGLAIDTVFKEKDD